MPHLHVDATTCAGYLYKVDSRVTSTPANGKGDASKNSIGDKSLSSIGSELTTSAFFSPATRRARKRSSRVASPSGAGGFMAALFHRSRCGKRRWFVLDRRRRLLIYYSCHTSKSSNAASLLKPKGKLVVVSRLSVLTLLPLNKNFKWEAVLNITVSLDMTCPTGRYEMVSTMVALIYILFVKILLNWYRSLHLLNQNNKAKNSEIEAVL